MYRVYQYSISPFFSDMWSSQFILQDFSKKVPYLGTWAYRSAWPWVTLKPSVPFRSATGFHSCYCHLSFIKVVTSFDWNTLRRTLYWEQGIILHSVFVWKECQRADISFQRQRHITQTQYLSLSDVTKKVKESDNYVCLAAKCFVLTSEYKVNTIRQKSRWNWAESSIDYTSIRADSRLWTQKRRRTGKWRYQMKTREGRSRTGEWQEKEEGSKPVLSILSPFLWVCYSESHNLNKSSSSSWFVTDATFQFHQCCTLCFNWAPHHEGVLGSGDIAPRILNLDSTWTWVVSFTPRPIYPQGKCGRYPLGSRAGLDAVVKGKIPRPCRYSNRWSSSP